MPDPMACGPLGWSNISLSRKIFKLPLIQRSGLGDIQVGGHPGLACVLCGTGGQAPKFLRGSSKDAGVISQS